MFTKSSTDPCLSHCRSSQFVLVGSKGTGDASAFETTVAFGYLLQVLLVVVLSVVKLLPLQDLSCDSTIAFFIQLLVVRIYT